MLRPDLATTILGYIETTYEASYTGLLTVNQEDDVYKFTIGVPSYMVPTVMITQADTDADFLTFIREELRHRNYMRLEIYKVIKTDETIEE